MKRSILCRGVQLLLLVAGVIGVLLARASDPAQASHTQIFLTPAGRLAPETVVGFINGPAVLVDVRVQDVHYPRGLGAFEFTVSFNPSVVSVLAVALGQFLGSTGRAINCPPSEITASSVNYSCSSIGSTLDGPLGSGVLATITFQPAASFGGKTATNLAFTKTHLLDITGDVPIAHQAINGSMLVAKCGDFNADKIITVGDILLIIQRFGSFAGPPPSPNWDPRFDLNYDGSVTVSDLLIEVQQFGRNCNA